MNTIQLKDFLLAENTLDGKEYAFISQNDKTRKINLDSLKEFIVGTGTLLTSDQSSIINAINEIQQTILNQSGGAGVLQTEIDKIKEDYVSKTNDLLENYSVGASTPTLIPTVQALTDVYDLLNGLITTINKNIGDKSKLTTTDVSTLVNAINEINNSLENMSLKSQELEDLIGGSFDVSVDGSLVDRITNLTTTIDTNKPIWDDKYTKAEVDNKVDLLMTNTAWKDSVATFSDLDTTYPNAQDGWTVFVQDTGLTYRYSNGAWVHISSYNLPLATASNDGRMSKEDKAYLDTIKSTSQAKWDSAVTHIGDADKHITSAERTLWNTVEDKADKTHTHVIADITDMPTKLSEFTNDTGYITKSDTSVSPFNVATESSPNVYQVTTGESLTSLKDGYGIRVAIPTNASGAVSIMVDSVTVPVTLSDGSAITDFKAGGVYSLTYYNGNFICASGGSSQTIDTVTFTSDKLLTGYTANDSNGKAVSGTMADKSNVTTQWCGYETCIVQQNPLDTSQALITFPNYDGAGYYDATSSICGNIGNLNPANIKAGVQIGRSELHGADATNTITGTFTADATATADKIVSGETAYVNGNKVTGTLSINGSPTTTLDCGDIYNLSAGYYSEGTITVHDLASQTQGDAVAGDIAKGKKAWVNGIEITGKFEGVEYSKIFSHFTLKEGSSINSKIEVGEDGFYSIYVENPYYQNTDKDIIKVISYPIGIVTENFPRYFI